MKITLLKEAAAGLLASLTGYVAGLIVGAAWAGNYAVDLQFAGQRGYEAGGLILAAMLGILAASAGAWTAARKEGKKYSLFLLGALAGGALALVLVWKFHPDSSLPFFVSIVLPPLGAILAGEISRP